MSTETDSSGSLTGGGHTCPICGQFIPNFQSHTCPTTAPSITVTGTFSPTPLERIATALELIVEILRTK